MRKVTLMLSLVLAQAAAAAPYAGTTWTNNTTITTALLNNVETGIQDAVGNEAINLKCDGTNGGNVVVTADVLGGTTGTSKTAVTGVSATCAPTSGVIALNGQDTNFAAANNTLYYGHGIWKEDGTFRTVLSQNTTPNLSNAAFSGYIFKRLVFVVQNKAAGSYSFRKFWQGCGKVTLMPYDTQVIVSGNANSGNATQSLSGIAPPTSVASTVDLTLNLSQTNSVASGSTSTLKTFFDSGFTVTSSYLVGRSVVSAGTECIETWENVAHDGNLYYAAAFAGSTSVAGYTIWLKGFTIDSLR